MKYKRWKEIREYNSRRYIIYTLIIFYLRQSFYNTKRVIYFFIKFKHNHIWNTNFYCVICRKSKRDLDIERVKLKENERTN